MVESGVADDASTKTAARNARDQVAGEGPRSQTRREG